MSEHDNGVGEVVVQRLVFEVQEFATYRDYRCAKLISRDASRPETDDVDVKVPIDNLRGRGRGICIAKSVCKLSFNQFIVVMNCSSVSMRTVSEAVIHQAL